MKHMSVKTREAPRLQPVLNTVRRFPMIWQIAAAMGAFVAARAPIFGELLPLGLCVTAGMPPSYVLCAGVGAVLGYALLLSIPQTSAYLGAVVAVVLLKLIGGDERYRDIPMVPVCAGGICYCLLRAGFSAAAGQGLTGILAGAAESLLILGLGYFMTVFFVHPLRILRQNDTESRAAVCFALIVLIACLAPYRIFEISFSHILGALVTLAAAWRGGRYRYCGILGCSRRRTLCRICHFGGWTRSRPIFNARTPVDRSDILHHWFFGRLVCAGCFIRILLYGRTLRRFTGFHPHPPKLDRINFQHDQYSNKPRGVCNSFRSPDRLCKCTSQRRKHRSTGM